MVFMSSGLFSRMGGTSLRVVGSKQKSSRCSRMGGTCILNMRTGVMKQWAQRPGKDKAKSHIAVPESCCLELAL